MARSQPICRRSRIAGTKRLLLLGILVATALAPPGVRAGQPDGSAYPSLFGSHEIRSGDLALFPKWRGAVARHVDERRLEEAPCGEGRFNRCHLRAWTRFLDGLRGAEPMVQIRTVNAFLNERRYVLDPHNYGVPDYWAAPGQFLTFDGDCEDYAIAKYFSLRALGFAPDSLRVVVLQDLNLGVAHAVLVVYLDGRALVLDNQVPTVVDARMIAHYRAIYSINEQHWWLHRL